MQDYDVTIVTLDNGKDYYVLKDITANNKRYCYFSNIENQHDICVRRVEQENNKSYFCYLDSEDEFRQAMKLFTEHQGS